VTLFIFGFVGYNVSKAKDVKAAKVGAWTGVIMGLFSAVLGIISFYAFPDRIIQALAAAAKQGVSSATTMSFLQIGIYVNLILSPLIFGLIGALLAWLGFLIFKKKK
jgi:Na+-driven multidrug efflux pump